MNDNGQQGLGGCPSCGCLMSSVKETRNIVLAGLHFRVRVRMCRYCKITYRTKEIVDEEIKLPARRKLKEEPKEFSGEKEIEPMENPFINKNGG